MWHQDLDDPSIAGNIYVANVDGIFVISWEEGVPKYRGMVENDLNFQVAHHADGAIINPPTYRDTTRGAAGVEDDGAGVAVCPTGFPFGNETNGGVAASFTSNQCRRIFIVTANDYYTEWPWT